ncbi:LysR family transcriptional regulator [Actinomyces dentalis]|uniref:LysR family transcriptional regulator n=1 Tax=Actinomyces dentalis TaxID=272548 RepID=UPI000416BACA|nr:LysR family transcriptional regulator [Actinomyces dentalis]
MNDRLSPEGLRYAQAVARTGSFSAAAREYDVTQPALSNAIRRLEKILGARLFERNTRGARPTVFGATILPRIDAALAALDAITAEAPHWRAGEPRLVRIGVSPLISADVVARAHSAVAGLPGRGRGSLVLREADLSELCTALDDDELDLIVVPAVLPLTRYRHRVIGSEPVVLVEPGAGDAAGPANFASPTNSADPTSPADPADPANSADPMCTAAPATSMRTANPASPADPAGPASPAAPAGSADPMRTAAPASPAEARAAAARIDDVACRTLLLVPDTCGLTRREVTLEVTLPAGPRYLRADDLHPRPARRSRTAASGLLGGGRQLPGARGLGGDGAGQCAPAPLEGDPCRFECAARGRRPRRGHHDRLRGGLGRRVADRG